MANAMISFRKTLVISGLLGLMSHAVVLAQTSTPQIVDKSTACIDLPTKKNCTGIGATIYPWFDDYPQPFGEKTKHAPKSITHVLTALPTSKVIIPKGLRQEYLNNTVYIATISGLGEKPDYMMYQPDIYQILRYGDRFWMRSFEGKDPADTVYLVGINSSCVLVDDYYRRHPEDSEPRVPGCWPTPHYIDSDEEYGNPSFQEEWGWIRDRHSKGAQANQLSAYRFDQQGILQNVTREVLPPLSALATPYKDLEKYWKIGFTGVVMDDQMLTKVPVFRWVGALYPDATHNIKSDPRITPSHQVFFTHVIWNGKTFELKRWVTPDIWPCGKHCAYDGFVYDPTIEVITQAKDGYVNLRAKPSTKATVIKKIPNDTRLPRKNTEGDWIHVYFEGDTGYVHQSQVLYE